MEKLISAIAFVVALAVVAVYLLLDVQQQQPTQDFALQQALQRENELYLQLQNLQEQNYRIELQTQLEIAAGQRAILEASARAVDNNTFLVAWNTIRGDVLTFFLLFVPVLAIGTFLLYGTLKRYKKEESLELPYYRIK